MPPGKPAHGFGYTPVDLEASYTPPDLGWGSTATSYEYNLDRQLKKVTRPDGQTIEYGFDTGGRLSTVTTPLGVTTYSYSPTTGTLSAIAAPGGVTLSYTWDGSLPTSTTLAGPVAGVVSRTYNSDFDVVSTTVAGTAVSYTYDTDRLLTGAGALVVTRSPTTGFVNGTSLGSVITARIYSGFGELATTSASAGATSLYATTYTRDSLGRIVQVDETIQGETSTTLFDYDTAGRLWKVTVDGVLTAEYLYDGNGNRTAVTNDLGLTTSATYDAQDRLLTYGASSYTHTKNGELATKTDASGVTTYSYDVLGNLRTVVLSDGKTIEYVIDGQNRRVGKKVNGTLVQGFVWDDQLRVVAELDGSGAVVGRFVYAEGVNVPEYMVKGGVTYRILSDHLGGPRLVVDVATGAVAQRIDRDEWGRVLQDTAPGFQPFGFAGGLHDHHTGLVRFGARDYDPEAGRWTSKDPIRFDGGDKNLYGYVLADPVNGVDPEGQQSGVDAAQWLSGWGPWGRAAATALLVCIAIYEFARAEKKSCGCVCYRKGQGPNPLGQKSDSTQCMYACLAAGWPGYSCGKRTVTWTD